MNEHTHLHTYALFDHFLSSFVCSKLSFLICPAPHLSVCKHACLSACLSKLDDATCRGRRTGLARVGECFVVVVFGEVSNGYRLKERTQNVHTGYDQFRIGWWWKIGCHSSFFSLALNKHYFRIAQPLNGHGHVHGKWCRDSAILNQFHSIAVNLFWFKFADSFKKGFQMVFLVQRFFPTKIISASRPSCLVHFACSDSTRVAIDFRPSVKIVQFRTDRMLFGCLSPLSQHVRFFFNNPADSIVWKIPSTTVKWKQAKVFLFISAAQSSVRTNCSGELDFLIRLICYVICLSSLLYRFFKMLFLASRNSFGPNVWLEHTHTHTEYMYRSTSGQFDFRMFAINNWISVRIS